MRGRRPRSTGISVCYVVGGMGHGGAERQLIYMLESLRSSAVSARILLMTADLPWESEIERLAVPMEHVGRNRHRPLRQAAVIESLRRHRPDIVQSAHFYTNTYAAVGAMSAGAMSIGAIRNDLDKEIGANGMFGWGHLYLPRYMIANSAPARDQALGYGRDPDRVTLVQNVVDTDRFAPAPEARPHAGHRELRLLFVGRLVPQKRPDRLVRLVRGLATSLPEYTVEARIAGDGPLRADLETMVADLDLSGGAVRFLGKVDDMVPLYRWADLLVLTSDYEGTPNAVIEAMACALPVVAFAVSGVPTLFSNGGGVLVEPGDEQTLLEAVTDLATDPERRVALGAEGRAHMCATRSVQALGRTLEGLYRRVVGTG